ncbi:integrase core domain-containing protein [Litorivita pollutaquae]
MDGRGRYLDNIFIERLWRSLKQEAVSLHKLQDGFQAERTINNWIVFYNADRPHTALDKRTPDDAYFDAIQVNQAACNLARLHLSSTANLSRKAGPLHNMTHSSPNSRDKRILRRYVADESENRLERCALGIRKGYCKQ